MAEQIWRGRIHLGDDPGIFGSAAYSGLATEFPVELAPFDEQEPDKAEVQFMIRAEEVKVYQGYPGHRAVLTGYFPSEKDPGRWETRELAHTRIDDSFDGTCRLEYQGEIPPFMSVGIRVDTSVAPGVYDDFVVTALELESRTHYASLGFRYRKPSIA